MLVYVLIVLDEANDPNYILVGNYEMGFQFDRIKWHLWGFAEFDPSSIGIDRDSDKKSVLKVGSLEGDIYEQEVGRTNDNDDPIENFVKFGFIGDRTGSIKHCGGINLRIKGSGSLAMQLIGQDAVDSQTLTSLTLAATPGKEYFRPAFFQSEKISLKLSLNLEGSYFSLHRANIYTNVIFESRPMNA